MKRLLLISNSTLYGSGYLDHCSDFIRTFLQGTKSVAFVPYALDDWAAYTDVVRKRFEAWGITIIGVNETPDPGTAIDETEAVFIGGGNTFRLLKDLYLHKLIEPIQRRVTDGLPYIGTSAGSNVACPTIKTTNDMPIVQPPSFDALNLVPFNINPHYLDADPNSRHMGETRAKRIEEFHQVNAPDVVALREGAMLIVEGATMTLAGQTGARLFRKGQQPGEFEPGADMSFLLG